MKFDAFSSLLFALLAVSLCASWLLLWSRRSASDVLADLSEPEEEKETERNNPSLGEKTPRAAPTPGLSALTEAELSELKRANVLTIVSGTLMAIAFGLFIKAALPMLLVLTGLGLALGYLLSQRRLRVREQELNRGIVFFLPVVMERIVMAVQSGLDIIPALKVLEEIDDVSLSKDDRQERRDPVTRLLGRVTRMCENGLSFEQSLKDVAQQVSSNALRHAFIHLAVAQKEGGELIYPLRELSDATQLYYQEDVEEEIATLPIKATMPLLFTFAGLIICFIAGPVVQVLTISPSKQVAAVESKSAEAAKRGTYVPSK